MEPSPPRTLSQCSQKRHSQHAVQFSENARALAKNTSLYLGEGLRRGEGLVVIATPDHREAFIRTLEYQGFALTKVLREGHLLLLNAEEMLSRFMVDGQPDPGRFEHTVGALIRKLDARADPVGLRAYGEMVDLLWKAGNSSAAMRLEELWNVLLAANRFSLLCAYEIDVFSREFQAGELEGVLRAHTHMVSAQESGDLEGAVDGAIKQVLGSRTQELKLLVQEFLRPAWAVIPRAEAKVLWLRSNLPDYADEILARARETYHASLHADPYEPCIAY